MVSIEVKAIIEALLFCSDKPLSVAQLQQQLVMRFQAVDVEEDQIATPVAEQALLNNQEVEAEIADFSPLQESIPLTTAEEIRQILQTLQQEYQPRGVQLVEVASGFRFQTAESVTPWILQAKAQKTPKYSRATLETLAIIAYKQPITRAEIEDVRGIAVSSQMIKTLQEREWIRVVGHKEVPGRPALFATTRQFLDYFNLRYLQDLPLLAELASPDAGVLSDAGILSDEAALLDSQV